jgi:predicted transcriptional regulator
MLNHSQMTVQLDPASIARLNEIAQHQNRSGDALVQELIGNYLKHRAWFESEIEKGLDDFREGRFYTDEEMKGELIKMGVNID